MNKPTEKQLAYIERIKVHIDKDRFIEKEADEHIADYIIKFFPNADINNLTREQAQKVISGLSKLIPTRPIETSTRNYYAYGRD